MDRLQKLAIWMPILYLVAGTSRGAAGVHPEAAIAPHVSLCDALEAVQIGDRLRISVSGAYRDGLLYDPSEMTCARDVQPVTLVEWAPSLRISAELEDLAGKHGSAFATFTGVLWGEMRPAPDDLGLPVAMAYGHRIGGFRRYGPNQGMRTKLVVERVEGLRSPPDTTAELSARKLDRSPLPMVQSATMSNLYPWKARSAHVSGDVLLEITVREGKASTRVISGDRLLAEDALANIVTWVFDPRFEGTFSTTFSYRFADMPSTTASVRVQTELPFRVEIIAPIDGW